MREIKFRAKIKNNDNIFDVTTIDFGNCVVCIVDPERGNQEAFDWSEIESLLQFTGLHDKNGKEIYEGDQVRVTGTGFYSNNAFCVEPIEADIWQFTGIVEMRSYLWSVNDLPFCDVIEEDMELEVIGNIYENHELVEGR